MSTDKIAHLQIPHEQYDSDRGRKGGNERCGVISVITRAAEQSCQCALG